MKMKTSAGLEIFCSVRKVVNILDNFISRKSDLRYFSSNKLKIIDVMNQLTSDKYDNYEWNPRFIFLKKRTTEKGREIWNKGVCNILSLEHIMQILLMGENYSRSINERILSSCFKNFFFTEPEGIEERWTEVFLNLVELLTNEVFRRIIQRW
jgi:hypothetical protein